MGIKNTYCLVGRNKENAQIQLFPEVGSSLEEIDIYTMKCKNNWELNDRLSRDCSDYKVFSYNKKYDRFFSPIYSSFSSIQDISEDFLRQDNNQHRMQIESYYKDFCYQMKYSCGFQDTVLHKRNDLYPKFIDYFRNRDMSKESLIHKDGGWVMKTYPLIRSVYHTLNSYPNLIDSSIVWDRIRNQLWEEFHLSRNVSEDPYELLQKRLLFYQAMRDDSKNKKKDITYYEDMILQIEDTIQKIERVDSNHGYQYQKKIIR